MADSKNLPPELAQYLDPVVKPLLKGFTPLPHGVHVSYNPLDSLPLELSHSQDIDHHFTRINREREQSNLSPFTNGKIVMVVPEEDDATGLQYCPDVFTPFTAGVGSYSRFIFLRDNPEEHEKHPAYSINPIAFVETADGEFLFGKMGPHTARAGQYLCAGSAMKTTDYVYDDDFQPQLDFEGNVLRAIKSEFGIELLCEDGVTPNDHLESLDLLGVHNYSDAFGISLVYHAKTNLSRENMQLSFKNVIAGKQRPQITEINFGYANPSSIKLLEQHVNTTEYVVPVLDYILQKP